MMSLESDGRHILFGLFWLMSFCLYYTLNSVMPVSDAASFPLCSWSDFPDYKRELYGINFDSCGILTVEGAVRFVFPYFYYSTVGFRTWFCCGGVCRLVFRSIKWHFVRGRSFWTWRRTNLAFTLIFMTAAAPGRIKWLEIKPGKTNRSRLSLPRRLSRIGPDGKSVLLLLASSCSRWL